MERHGKSLGKATEMKTPLKSFQNEENLLGHKTASRHQLLKYEPALVWPAGVCRSLCGGKASMMPLTTQTSAQSGWPHRSYRNKQPTCMRGSQPAAQECVYTLMDRIMMASKDTSK